MSILVCGEKTGLALFYIISQNLPEKSKPITHRVACLLGHLPFISHIFTLFQENFTCTRILTVGSASSETQTSTLGFNQLFIPLTLG